MYRNIIEKLKAWKNSELRKPLILAGARQVGKTYILKEFGKAEYSNVAYVNCDKEAMAKTLFVEDYDIKRIVMAIAAITGETIVPGKTLIILDEIQEVKRGLSVLKYFCEDAPEYHVAVAGSLLGITMRQGESVPVGKVDVLHMYPMTYDEFLLAKGKEQMCDILKSKDWKTIKLLRGEYIKILREYYFVGGMPEAVKRFLKTNDPNQVRDVQYEILYTYQKAQLAKENKKFMYGVAKKGGRAKDFEVAIQWLMGAGLVYKSELVKEAKMSLKYYVNINSFKLFLLDCGLLGAMSETAPESLLVAANGMEEAKGAFTENYVMSQLVASRRNSVFYYSSGNKLELDFLSKPRLIYKNKVESGTIRTLSTSILGESLYCLDELSQCRLFHLPLYIHRKIAMRRNVINQSHAIIRAGIAKTIFLSSLTKRMKRRPFLF